MNVRESYGVFWLKTFEKPLTAGEEAEILRRLKDGTSLQAKEAKEILIEKNLMSMR